MSMRASIAITAGVAVLVAVLVASLALYFATAAALRDGVDDGLRRLAGASDEMVARTEVIRAVLPRPGTVMRNGDIGYIQPLDRRGHPRIGNPAQAVPVSERAADVAREGEGPFFETLAIDGEPVRVLTIALDSGGALQLARPITDVEAALDTLRTRLVAVVFGGVLLATLLGAVVARRAVEPVHDLTELVEEVSATRDLTRRIRLGRTNDDIRRLADTFNDMLRSLEQARRAQEQLVADASHELRTPLTSIRTNIEVLFLAGEAGPARVSRDAKFLTDALSEPDRHALVGDVLDQLREFGRLVDSLVDLARGDAPAHDLVAVRLDQVVRDVAERAQMFSDGVPFMLDLSPTVVYAEEDRLGRAVANLLDNAVKYGGDREVTVRVAQGCVEVCDLGPGIRPEHLSHVFDRFYRAPEAWSAPGSGLGLSIVRQVAETHGGSVTASNRAGGGMRFTLQLPEAPKPPPPPEEEVIPAAGRRRPG
jgi:two-component system, OmpR family, sensor histidine kinase MprB